VSGWWVESRVFTDAECDRLLASVSDTRRSRAGVRHLIPDSPLDRVATDDEVAQIVATREAVDVTCPRGGVIAMRPLIIHASSNAISDAPRRVLHIEYADTLQLSDRARLAIV